MGNFIGIRTYIQIPLKTIKSITLVIIICLYISCVEKFTPELKTTSDLLVIDGNIIRNNNQQTVQISRTTTIDNPEFNPVSRCNVFAIDNSGNRFYFYEESPGEYIAPIPIENMEFGTTFQLNVTTPDGSHYQSEPETILESSPIDSLYFEIESFQSSSETYDKGLQFYADLKAPEDSPINYRWTIEETWEIHTFYEIKGYYVKETEELIFTPIYDLSICWDTNNINEIFTSSTENLTLNEKKKIPLNYVPSVDEKINFVYSILVRQYALSNNAYNYWSNHQSSGKESGGLYTGQPSQTISNIYNTDNANEVVLGCFWASSYTEKRIFFNGPLTSIHNDCGLFICDPFYKCDMVAHLRSKGGDTIYFTKAEGNWAWPYSRICINCTADGATTIKPEFWK